MPTPVRHVASASASASASAPARVHVRPAGPEDHATIRKVVRAAYVQYVTDVPPELWEVYLADLLDLDRHARAGQLLVALVDGQVAGYAAFYPDAAAQGVGWPARWASGRGLAVSPAARGHGVANALVAEIERLARAAGSPVFAFHTSEFMSTAVALYERLGYRRAPEFDLDVTDHYRVPADTPWRARAYLRRLAADAA